MKSNSKDFILVVAACLMASNAYAQFGGLLNDLKNIKKSVEQPQAQQPPQPATPTAPATAPAAAPAAATATAPATAPAAAPATATATATSDAYCEKIMKSNVAIEFTKKYVLIQTKLDELERENLRDPARIQFIRQTTKAFAQGLDDDNRSKTQALLKKLDVAIPKKGDDILGRDIPLLGYAAWFSSCASKLSESPLRFIFLNPASDRESSFYKTNISNRDAKLQEIMGGPSFGSRNNDRRIEDNTGLTPLGINPRWVTPMLFLSDDLGLQIDATQANARLESIINQINARINSVKTAKLEMRAAKEAENKASERRAEDAKAAKLEANKEYEAKQAIEADTKLEPLRKLIQFSKNKDIAPAFQICIKTETSYHDQLVNKSESIIKNMTTKQEQQNATEIIAKLRKMKPVGIPGFCLLRLTSAMDPTSGMDPVGSVLGIAAGQRVFYGKWKALQNEDFNNKYTGAGLEKIANNLKMSPESFRRTNKLTPEYVFDESMEQTDNIVYLLMSGKIKF